MTKEEKAKSKILVVDDSRVMRAAVKKILGNEYEIIEAENGELGWDCISEDLGIQLVFCDLNMPVLNGHELLKRIRNSDNTQLQNIPVVIITGNDDDDETKEQVLENGANDFISKPFDSLQLQARAKSYVTLKRKQENATIDELTGLGSLRYYEKVVTEEIAHIHRHSGECVMLHLEINDFKQLFIKNGRDSANNILKDVGKIIQDIVRTEDKAARVNLATFSLFVQSVDINGAVQFVNRIRKNIHDATFNINSNTDLKITTSVGLFEPDINDETTFDSIFKKSKKCLTTALETKSNDIIIDTELDNSNDSETQIKEPELTLIEALDLINKNDFNKIIEAKNNLLIQLIPLLKHVITDNSMLKKMVSLLKK